MESKGPNLPIQSVDSARRLLGFKIRGTCLSWVTMLAAPAAANNLILNPSFDSGTSGWSRYPSSWSSCATALGDGQGWAGMRLACNPPPAEARLRQTVPVEGGQFYRVGFRFSASSLSAEGDVILVFRNSQGVVWQTGVEEFAGTAPWSEIRWVVQAPATATQVEVRVGVSGFEGEARFDDILLEKLDAAPAMEFSVDLRQVVGELRNLNQTNRGPVAETRWGTLVDYSSRLAAAAVTAIRSHDVHTAYDMSVIFPNANADAASPSSYQFASTDQAIAQTLDGGFEVFFRLGESYGGPKTPRMSAAKWANVVRKVVEHVNGSFASGLHAGVRYWEIWNEANGPLFWSGTKEEFYDLFSRAAVAIKAADPAVRVGGPGMAGHTDEAWLRGLLRHARAANAPVDFVSWHLYHMGSPHSFARAQRQIRALVDEEGFPDAEVLLTEWNMTGAACESTGCRPYVTGAYNAAHLVGAITHLQDTDLPLAFRYRTDGPQAFGLFGDGDVEPAWGRTGLAFLVLRKLYETPVRLAATGGDGAGITVLAGRNPSGSQVRIAVASQASPSNSYRLRLQGAPERFSYTVYEIADRHPCEPGNCALAIVRQGDQRDWRNSTLEISLPAPAVHLVTIDVAGGIGNPRRVEEAIEYLVPWVASDPLDRDPSLETPAENRYQLPELDP